MPAIAPAVSFGDVVDAWTSVLVLGAGLMLLHTLWQERVRLLGVLWLCVTGRAAVWHRHGVPLGRAARWAWAGLSVYDYTDWNRLRAGWGDPHTPRHIKAAITAGVTTDEVIRLPGAFIDPENFGPLFAAGLTCQDIHGLAQARIPESLARDITQAVRRRPTVQDRDEVLAWATSAPLAPKQTHGGQQWRNGKGVHEVIHTWRKALGPSAHRYVAAGLTLDEAMAMQQAPDGPDLDALAAMVALRQP